MARAGVFRLDVNRLPGDGNNVGAEAALAEYAPFLNSDAFVTSGWLEPVMARLEGHRRLGAVLWGPMASCCRSGSRVPMRMRTYRGTRLWAAAQPPAFWFPATFLLKIGGSKYGYERAYCEAPDFCCEIAACGLLVGCCDASRVVRIGNATPSTHRQSPGLTNIIEVNRGQFLSRWGACKHFGISVLEAMSHGMARFAVANGGPSSFMRDGATGYRCRGLDELQARVMAALNAPGQPRMVRRGGLSRARLRRGCFRGTLAAARLNLSRCATRPCGLSAGRHGAEGSPPADIAAPAMACLAPMLGMCLAPRHHLIDCELREQKPLHHVVTLAAPSPGPGDHPMIRRAEPSNRLKRRGEM